jgi:hypothetical protein
MNLDPGERSVALNAQDAEASIVFTQSVFAMPLDALAQLDAQFLEAFLRQRFIHVFFHVVVLLRLAHVLGVDGRSKHDDVAVFFSLLGKLFEFVEELEAVHEGHVDVQKDDFGKGKLVRSRNLLHILQKFNCTLPARMSKNMFTDVRGLNDFLIDQVIDLIIINQHDGVKTGCIFGHNDVF